MFFKGHYRFLSNFYPCTLRSWGMTFHSSEHLYVACKIPKENMELRYHVSQTTTAADAKKFGRIIEVREDWDDIKVDVMRSILLKKFSQPPLKERLLEVDKEIVEHNKWHDNFWGSCVCRRCGNKGENKLGKLLEETKKNFLNS